MSISLDQMITYDICKGLYHFGLLNEISSRDKDKTIGRCVDVEMCRCGDVKMWRYVDVDMWRSGHV